MVTVGQRIANERKRVGFTQVELAQLAECHEMSLSRWERDVKVPSPASAGKLAAVLGVRESWLLYGGRKAL